MQAWISAGPRDSWRVALEKGGVWAVRDGERLLGWWRETEPGDLLFLYVTDPVSGVVGVGRVTGTREDREPRWPDELRAGESKYPYRIDFDPIRCLSPDEWRDRRIGVDDLVISTFGGLKPIRDEESLAALLDRCRRSWDAPLPADDEEIR